MGLLILMWAVIYKSEWERGQTFYLYRKIPLSHEPKKKKWSRELKTAFLKKEGQAGVRVGVEGKTCAIL